MIHDGYFLGMHFAWWGVWLVVLMGAFAIHRWKKDSPREILQKRYTIGEITAGEYNMRMEHFLDMISQD
jgi:hypothetical protein